MIKEYLLTALLALLPISELRGAIPFAYFSGIKLPYAFFFSTAINMLVPIIGFVFLSTIHNLLYKWNFYRNFFDKTVIKARTKIEEKVNRFGILGLMIFVAIPLPITGAWTGTLGAWILGLPKKKSTLSIILGVLIAGIIVSLIIYTGIGINSIFIKSI